MAADERRLDMAAALTEFGRLEGRLVTKVEALSGEVLSLGGHLVSLDRKVSAHIADEEGLGKHIHELRVEVKEMANQRLVDARMHERLLGGHEVIIGRMDQMQSELARNTEVTEAVRDKETFWRGLKERWKAVSFWIGSAGAVIYGIWQAWEVWTKHGG